MRYIGIDYSGATTPTQSLPGLQVVVATDLTFRTFEMAYRATISGYDLKGGQGDAEEPDDLALQGGELGFEDLKGQAVAEEAVTL